MTEISKEKFEPFIKSLLDINKDINLISREVKAEELFAKHIYDSVKIINFFDFSGGQKLLDIGSGGGIPGIPLAISLPDLQVTLFDSVDKKMRAAKFIADSLKLNNVSTIVGRTEEKAHDQSLRESFDIVTARAVAGLPILLEYALPFLKVGGHFIAYKGKNYQEELNASENALKLLGGEIVNIYSYELPDNLGERVYIICEKKSPTKKIYPRSTGTPKKSPL